MTLKDSIIGELGVYTAEQRVLTEDDVYFVKAVANLGSIAWERPTTYG